MCTCFLHGALLKDCRFAQHTHPTPQWLSRSPEAVLLPQRLVATLRALPFEAEPKRWADYDDDDDKEWEQSHAVVDVGVPQALRVAHRPSDPSVARRAHPEVELASIRGLQLPSAGAAFSRSDPDSSSNSAVAIWAQAIYGCEVQVRGSKPHRSGPRPTTPQQRRGAVRAASQKTSARHPRASTHVVSSDRLKLPGSARRRTSIGRTSTRRRRRRRRETSQTWRLSNLPLRRRATMPHGAADLRHHGVP